MPSNFIMSYGATNAPPLEVRGTFHDTLESQAGIPSIISSPSLGQLNDSIGTGNGFPMDKRYVFGADSKPLSSITVRLTLKRPGSENVLLTDEVFSIGLSRSENDQMWTREEESPSGSNEALMKMYSSPIFPSLAS